MKERRDICIVTFQSAYNFGAVLQAYALQEFLQRNYGNVKILDYHNSDIDYSYEAPKMKLFFHNPKNAVHKVIQYNLFKGKRNKIDLFRRKLNLTSMYTRENIEDAVKEADIYITGSDQVWNYQIMNRDKTFFLDFAHDKIRVSYAASFGVASIPEEYREFYIEQLNSPDFISCRELRGCEIIKELTGRDCYVMPDPTMLIDKSVWDNISVKPSQDNYILVYKITKADKLIPFANMLSKRTGLPIIYIPNDLKSGFVGKTLFNVGPEEWLGYIRNASYVVTNSFHGAVFSIIFGTKFFAEFSSKTNATTSRLYSLLTKFNMEERSITNFTTPMIGKELDYKNINRVIEASRRDVQLFFSEIM